MIDAPEGFVRDTDGILVRDPKLSVFDNRSYREPNEAIKTWYAGELRVGCNERRFENYSSFPCGNKAKHDPDANGNPTKCGVHSQTAKGKRKAKSDAKMQKWRDGNARRDAIAKLREERNALIIAIASGHNDPRGACSDWLQRYNAAKEATS